jgi:hypothetical protein
MSLLGGCATAGLDVSSLDKPTPLAPTARSAGHGLVQIRFPIITDDEDTFRAWYRTFSGWEGSEEPFPANAHREAVAKTAYYALELYQRMIARLPEQGVLLQPVHVVQGSDGFRFKSPMVLPPTVMVVDLVAYVGREPLNAGTFGDRLSLSMRAATAPEASPTTSGHLFGSANLKIYENVPGNDGPRFKPGEMVRIATKSIDLPASEVEAADKPTTGAENGFPSRRVFDGIVSLSSDVLNSLDHREALRPGRAAYAEYFDPDLAARIRAGSVDGADTAKAQLLEQFEKVEREFLVAQQRSLVDTLYRGPFGNRMRDLRAAELKQQQSHRTRQAVMMATAILGGLATGISTMRTAGTPQANLALQQQQQFLSSMASLSQEAKSATAAQLVAFATGVSDLISEQTKSVVTAEGQRAEVTAKDLQGLREQLRAFYRQTFMS